MNNLLMRGCDRTVTLWNRRRDNDTRKDTWYRTVLPVKCGWNSHERRFFSANGSRSSGNANAVPAGSCIVVIPYSDRYLPFDVWDALPEDIRVDYFTLSLGDVLAQGEYDGGIPAESVKGAKAPLFGGIPAESVTVKGIKEARFLEANLRRGAHLRVECTP